MSGKMLSNDTTTSVTKNTDKNKSGFNFIPNRVTLKQCRKNTFLPAGHDGEYRYSNTLEYLTVQNKRGTNQLITGLTPELEREFEKKLNLPGISEKMPQGTLSKYNKAFWATFKIPIPQGGLVLDIANNPMHELYWYVLNAHQEVAASEEARLYNPYARYVLTSEEQEIIAINKKIEIKSMAYRKFNLMAPEDMRNFLKVYKTTSRVDIDAKNIHSEAIHAAVGQIVEEAPKKFLYIVNDPGYTTRLFLEQCVEDNLVDHFGSQYFLKGGDLIGNTTDGALTYLSDKKNTEVVLTLKTRLAAIRNDNTTTT